MSSIRLIDVPDTNKLLPLTYLKEVQELQVGIFNQQKSWELAYQLRKNEAKSAGTLLIDARLLSIDWLAEQVFTLQLGEALWHEEDILAVCAPEGQLKEFCALLRGESEIESKRVDVQLPSGKDLPCIIFPWDLFLRAGDAIREDFYRLRQIVPSAKIPEGVQCLNSESIHISSGAKLRFCTLNAEDGPIYIGPYAEIMEGAHLRGPLSIGEHATVKMGAKIYGDTVIGAHCKVGGEVSNALFQPYSNKGHDGFIGNAVIGSWCNLGADTNCSNLKNNYQKVRVFSIAEERFVKTGLQFCGVIMGDHSKTGINTMLNTATVIGAFCNIWGDGFPRQWIPSFSWGGAKGMRTHKLEEALETARVMMARRGLTLSEAEVARIDGLFESTKSQRPYER